MERKLQPTLESAEREMHTALRRLLLSYSPEELEDMIFQVFEDCNLHSDGLDENEKLKRYEFHSTLRTILKTLDKHPEILKKFV